MRIATLLGRALLMLGLLALVPIGAVLVWILPGFVRLLGLGLSVLGWFGIVHLLGSGGGWYEE